MKGISKKEFLKKAKERGVKIQHGNNVPKPRKRPVFRYRFWVLGGDNREITARNMEEAKRLAHDSLELDIRRDI